MYFLDMRLVHLYLSQLFPLSRFRANIVVQCENWWNLAKQFASRSPPLHMLSSTVQRTLMKALVLGGFAHMNSDTKQQYWAEVRNQRIIEKYLEGQALC